LINAYKTASLDALENGEIIERNLEAILSIRFSYFVMNDVMKVMKEENPTVLSQSFDNECAMQLQVRLNDYEKLKSRLENIEGVSVE